MKKGKNSAHRIRFSRTRKKRRATLALEQNKAGVAARNSILPDRNYRQPTLGVLYVCFGEPYKKMATLSVSLLRHFGYDGPVRIVTDSDGWIDESLQCELIEVPFRGLGFATRYYKTQLHHYGFDVTLFLDADTVPIAPITSIWRELRFADVCLPLDVHPYVHHLILTHFDDRLRCLAEYAYMKERKLLDHPLHSSGLMLFRRSRSSDKLFQRWHREWKWFQQEDQLALVRATASVNLELHTLAPRWNGRVHWFSRMTQAQSAGFRVLHNSHKLLPDAVFFENDADVPDRRDKMDPYAETIDESALGVTW
jgi:hypothetical protein